MIVALNDDGTTVSIARDSSAGGLLRTTAKSLLKEMENAREAEVRGG